MALAWGVPAKWVIENTEARELAEWHAFERVWGPLTVQERIDSNSAITAWAALKAGGAQTPVEDLYPEWDEAKWTPKAQSAEEMIAVMRGFQRKKRKGKP